MPCAPCRGTGQVISNLGGSPSQVACPWCEGSGTQIPGHDAQAARSAAARSSGAPARDRPAQAEHRRDALTLHPLTLQNADRR